MDLGSGILKNLFPDLGSRVKNAQDTGSRIRIRNTVFYLNLLFPMFLFCTDRIADGLESSGVEIQAPGLGGLDQVLHKGRLVV
jgi:hypothetical protein